MVFEKDYQEYVYACVDIIITDNQGKILLTKRNVEPFKDSWILPGGRMKPKELAIEAAKRKVYEETGLQIKINKLYGTYADPDRDPRCYTVSIIYLAEINGGKMIKTISVSDYKWINKKEIPKNIGFDHKNIIKDYFKNPKEQKIDNNLQIKDFDFFKK